MPASVRVELDLSRLYSLTQNAEMGTMLYRKAQAVLGRAQGRAPVETGRYRRSFRVAFAQTDRRVVRVHNDAPYAVIVEYGGSHSVKHRTLGASLDTAGGA